MIRVKNLMLVGVFMLSLCFSTLYAQEDKIKGMPPAKVVVAKVTTGMIAPVAEFIGTVYYQEVSDVATEVNGVVEEVNFEEGQRVKSGYVLVKLSSDLLEKTLQSTKASYEQILSDLEKARRDLKRAESLYREALISEQSIDENRFRVLGIEKQSESLKADIERLEIELQKKAVKAPFKGVVIKRYIERGEWLAQGATVATIAKDRVVDIIVEVPEKIIKYVKPGKEVPVRAGGRNITGKVFTIIPSGDISTRTFPVKIRMLNRASLVEGMEARVSLPTGRKKEAFIIQRDAIVTMFGVPVVFTVVDSKALMIPVEVIGYEGKKVGIHTERLTEGMNVVIKGNERLRDEQLVEIKD